MNDTQNKPDGIVYVLSNRGFWLPEREGDPEVLQIVKIGRTDTPTAIALKGRMSSLFGSGVAFPFDLEYAKSVQNCATVESDLHTIFNRSRVNPNREFFHVEVESVVAALKPYPGEEITLDDEVTGEVTQPDITARNQLPKRRVISFDYMKIPVGATLHFVRDENETATVVSDTKVTYKGEEMSPFAAARGLWKIVYGNGNYFRASRSWTYNGELLMDIQQRMDAKHGIS